MPKSTPLHPLSTSPHPLTCSPRPPSLLAVYFLSLCEIKNTPGLSHTCSLHLLLGHMVQELSPPNHPPTFTSPSPSPSSSCSPLFHHQLCSFCLTTLLFLCPLSFHPLTSDVSILFIAAHLLRLHHLKQNRRRACMRDPLQSCITKQTNDKHHCLCVCVSCSSSRFPHTHNECKVNQTASDFIHVQSQTHKQRPVATMVWQVKDTSCTSHSTLFSAVLVLLLLYFYLAALTLPPLPLLLSCRCSTSTLWTARTCC